MVIDRLMSIIDGDTPAWVNEKLFENLLLKEVPDFQKLLKFSTKHVNNYKDNYMNIKIEFEAKDGKRRLMGFILKTATFSSGEKILPYLNNATLHQENLINFEIVPKFETLYEAEKKPSKMWPTAFKFPQSVPEDYILFEDLQYKGYRPVQRDANGLNTKQMEFVLDKLAAFHAAGVVVAKSNKANNKLPGSPNKDQQYLNNRIFHESLRLYGLKCYEDTIKSLQSHFLHNRSFSNPLEFQVLLLGNCCVDNMLFLSDAFGNIKDLVFINLNTCSYGNPVKDLLYLLLSSTSSTDKTDKFEYYVKYYHEQLTCSLKLLKFKGQVPKLAEMHYDLIVNNQWAFEAVTQVLPLVLWDPNGVNSLNSPDYDDGQSSDQFLKVMYAQQSYCQQIQKLIPWMENKAFLEE